MANPQLTRIMAAAIAGEAMINDQVNIPGRYYWFEDFCLTLEFIPWSGLFVLTVICDQPVGIGTIRCAFDIPASATECTLDPLPLQSPRYVTVIAWLVPELAEVLQTEIAQPA